MHCLGTITVWLRWDACPKRRAGFWDRSRMPVPVGNGPKAATSDAVRGAVALRTAFASPVLTREQADHPPERLHVHRVVAVLAIDKAPSAIEHGHTVQHEL